MKYTQIQRGNIESIITIGEYIQATAPEIFMRLHTIFMAVRVRDITETVLAAADVDGMDKYYQRIMQERPHPGRGGLLPGEGEEAL